MIEFLAYALVFGVVAGFFWVLWWFFFGPVDTEALGKPKHRTITDDDEDESDPNWEDHIRHDPYHPAGNQGYSAGGYGVFDEHHDHEDEER